LRSGEGRRPLPRRAGWAPLTPNRFATGSALRAMRPSEAASLRSHLARSVLCLALAKSVSAVLLSEESGDISEYMAGHSLTYLRTLSLVRIAFTTSTIAPSIAFS